MLLELLHASSSPCLALLTPTLLFLLFKTSFSPQCHAVKSSSTPSKTTLYVFRNRRPNSIASTSFRNRGSFPGSSGSTSLPPPAVAEYPASQGGGVEAVAVSAKRRMSCIQGVEAMVATAKRMQREGWRRLHGRRPALWGVKGAARVITRWARVAYRYRREMPRQTSGMWGSSCCKRS